MSFVPFSFTANAYGVAVSGTMFMTTCLITVAIIVVWEVGVDLAHGRALGSCSHASADFPSYFFPFLAEPFHRGILLPHLRHPGWQHLHLLPEQGPKRRLVPARHRWVPRPHANPVVVRVSAQVTGQ